MDTTNGITVDLLRHGEVEGGARYRGSTDDALTATGFEQMRHATTRHPPWDKIISSPLLRCSEYARQLSQQISSPLETDHRLKEICFGEWEGNTAEALLKKIPASIKQYWEDPINNTPPGGETIQCFEKRANDFWQDLAKNHQEQHILVITHAGIIRMILHFILCTPLASLFNINVPHACMSRIHITFDKDAVPQPCLISHAGTHTGTHTGNV